MNYQAPTGNRVERVMRSLLCIVTSGLLSAAAIGCRTSECARGNYALPECRVIAENEFSRLEASSGSTLKFHRPGSIDPDWWDPLGRIEEGIDGQISARVATLGDFLVSVQNTNPAASDEVSIRLENVDPRANVVVERSGTAGQEIVMPAGGLTRDVSIALGPGETALVHGTIACPSRYRVIALGDIQTNPLHFEAIMRSIARESLAATNAGEPILGGLLLGDLAETSAEPELRTIYDILSRSPVPFAVLPGNHDIYSRRTPYYNRLFGPGNYDFRLCNSKFALFDTGSGGIAESVQARSQEILARGDAKFLLAAMHHPPFPGLTGSGWTREDQAQMLLADMALQRTDLVLAGHVHALLDMPALRLSDFRLRQVIAGTGGATQGFGVPTYGYVRLTFGEQLSMCFVEVPPPGSERGTGIVPSSLGRCDELER